MDQYLYLPAYYRRDAWAQPDAGSWLTPSRCSSTQLLAAVLEVEQESKPAHTQKPSAGIPLYPGIRYWRGKKILVDR